MQGRQLAVLEHKEDSDTSQGLSYKSKPWTQIISQKEIEFDESSRKRALKENPWDSGVWSGAGQE